MLNPDKVLSLPPTSKKMKGRGRAMRCTHLVGIAVLGHLVCMIKWLKREEKPL